MKVQQVLATGVGLSPPVQGVSFSPQGLYSHLPFPLPDEFGLYCAHLGYMCENDPSIIPKKDAHTLHIPKVPKP